MTEFIHRSDDEKSFLCPTNRPPTYVSINSNIAQSLLHLILLLFAIIPSFQLSTSIVDAAPHVHMSRAGRLYIQHANAILLRVEELDLTNAQYLVEGTLYSPINPSEHEGFDESYLDHYPSNIDCGFWARDLNELPIKVLDITDIAITKFSSNRGGISFSFWLHNPPDTTYEGVRCHFLTPFNHPFRVNLYQRLEENGPTLLIDRHQAMTTFFLMENFSQLVDYGSGRQIEVTLLEHTSFPDNVVLTLLSSNGETTEETAFLTSVSASPGQGIIVTQLGADSIDLPTTMYDNALFFPFIVHITQIPPSTRYLKLLFDLPPNQIFSRTYPFIRYHEISTHIPGIEDEWGFLPRSINLSVPMMMYRTTESTMVQYTPTIKLTAIILSPHSSRLREHLAISFASHYEYHLELRYLKPGLNHIQATNSGLNMNLSFPLFCTSTTPNISISPPQDGGGLGFNFVQIRIENTSGDDIPLVTVICSVVGTPFPYQSHHSNSRLDHDFILEWTLGQDSVFRPTRNIPSLLRNDITYPPDNQETSGSAVHDKTFSLVHSPNNPSFTHLVSMGLDGYIFTTPSNGFLIEITLYNSYLNLADVSLPFRVTTMGLKRSSEQDPFTGAVSSNTDWQLTKISSDPLIDKTIYHIVPTTAVLRDLIVISIELLVSVRTNRPILNSRGTTTREDIWCLDRFSNPLIKGINQPAIDLTIKRNSPYFFWVSKNVQRDPDYGLPQILYKHSRPLPMDYSPMGLVISNPPTSTTVMSINPDGSLNTGPIYTVSRQTPTTIQMVLHFKPLRTMINPTTPYSVFQPREAQSALTSMKIQLILDKLTPDLRYKFAGVGSAVVTTPSSTTDILFDTLWENSITTTIISDFSVDAPISFSFNLIYTPPSLPQLPLPTRSATSLFESFRVSLKYDSVLNDQSDGMIYDYVEGSFTLYELTPFIPQTTNNIPPFIQLFIHQISTTTENTLPFLSQPLPGSQIIVNNDDFKLIGKIALLSADTKGFISFQVCYYPKLSSSTFSTTAVCPNPQVANKIIYNLSLQQQSEFLLTVTDVFSHSSEKSFVRVLFSEIDPTLTNHRQVTITDTHPFISLPSCYKSPTEALSTQSNWVNQCQHDGLCERNNTCTCTDGWVGQFCQYKKPTSCPDLNIMLEEILPTTLITEETHRFSVLSNNRTDTLLSLSERDPCTSPANGYLFFTSSECPSYCTCHGHWSGLKCQSCQIQCRHGSEVNCTSCLCEPTWSGAFCQCQGTEMYLYTNLHNDITTEYHKYLASSTVDSVPSAITEAYETILQHLREDIEKVLDIQSGSLLLTTTIRNVDPPGAFPNGLVFHLTVSHSCQDFNVDMSYEEIKKRLSSLAGKIDSLSYLYRYFLSTVPTDNIPIIVPTDPVLTPGQINIACSYGSILSTVITIFAIAILF